jgi:hypothetical protein
MLTLAQIAPYLHDVASSDGLKKCHSNYEIEEVHNALQLIENEEENGNLGDADRHHSLMPV